MAPHKCQVPKCTAKFLAKGYCRRHYGQVRDHGSVFVSSRDKRPAIIEGNIAKIPLGIGAKDGYAIVDKEYAHLADENWCKTYYGYAVRRDRKTGKIIRMHVLILGVVEGKEIDHINNERLDNRKANLRHCAHHENGKNLALRASNRFGYKGIAVRGSKFVAQIGIDKTSKYLGIYETVEDAARAYDKAAKKLHGSYARLNYEV